MSGRFSILTFGVAVAGLAVTCLGTVAPTAHAEQPATSSAATEGGWISVRPNPIVAEYITVRGALPSKVKRPVRLQRNSSNGWFTVTKGHTTNAGAFALPTRSPFIQTTTAYRVVAPRVAINGRAWPAVTTPVVKTRTHPQHFYDYPQSYALVGRKARIDAYAYPARPGRPVVLKQRHRDGSYTVAARTDEDTDGHATLYVTRDTVGDLSLKAQVVAWHGAASVARFLSVHFSKQKSWLTLATGNDYSCALKADHTLWCWGVDWPEHPFGAGLENHSAAHAVPAAAGAQWTEVSAGMYGRATCGVRSDHTAWCWGSNRDGEVGDGTHGNDSVSLPAQVGVDADWASIDRGSRTTCGIKFDHTAWCWGNNAEGELGNGTTVSSDVPTAFGPGSTWQSIAAATGYITCGIKTDTTMWCTTVFGGLRQVGTQTGWASVTVGQLHRCGVREDGSAWCWGTNTHGDFGTGSVSGDSTTPVRVNGGNWERLSAAQARTCGIKSDGTAWCWGSGWRGQLGVGDDLDHSTPTKVAGSGYWRTIDVDAQSTCGLHLDGTAWCWGASNMGLGDGFERYSLSLVPVPVV